MPTYRLTFRDHRPLLTFDADFWRREGQCLTFYQSRVVILTQRWIVVRRVELRWLATLQQVSS